MIYRPGAPYNGPPPRSAGCWKWGAIIFFSLGFLIVGGAVGGAALLGLFNPIDFEAIKSAQREGGGSSQGEDRGAISNSGQSLRGAQPGRTTDGEWQVRFVVDGTEYSGRLPVREGEGTMTITYESAYGPMRVEERCSVTGTDRVNIRCRNPQVLSGRDEYHADSFELTFVDENLMRGTLDSENGATGTATFTRR